MNPVKPSAVGTVCLLTICLTAYVQVSASTISLEGDTLGEVVENITDASFATTADTGEASYNIENCQALLDKDKAGAKDQSKEGESVKPGGEVEPLDLDKCRAMFK